MKRSINYINNKDLYESMKKYRESVQEAIQSNKQKPRIPDYIGKSILLICKNLSVKPNFSGYTYKEDMISDAITDCVAGIDNFDPNKTNNPFAYFTQIAWNAYIRRIHKEKKQNYVKHKNFYNSYLVNDTSDEMVAILKTSEYSDEIIRNYEKGFTKDKKSTKLSGIERFVEKDE